MIFLLSLEVKEKTNNINELLNLYLVMYCLLLNCQEKLKTNYRFYFNHPALRITARVKNKIRKDQVALFKVDSALLALVNIELPLDASPPIPSPFGL